EIERAYGAQVHVTRGAAFELRCRGRLRHDQAAEQLGWEDVEVDFPVRVRAGQVAVRGDGDVVAVQGDLGEAGTEPADRDLLALTGVIAVDLHARDPV